MLLGQAKVTIGLDDQEYKKGVENAKKSMGGLEQSVNSVKKALKGLTVAWVSKKLVGGLISAYKAAEEADKIHRKLAQTIKATGGAAGLATDELIRMASAMQELTGVNDEEIKNAQNLLLTFKQIGGDIFPQVTMAVLDMSEAMGQDLKSSAIQIGKALNDPLLGLTALSHVGVAFTEVQKKMIKEMVKAGDVVGAQKIILKKLESEFSGAAEAAKAAGKVFSSAVDDLQESIGRFNNSVVGEKFLNWTTSLVKQWTVLIDRLRVGSTAINELGKLGQDDLFLKLSQKQQEIQKLEKTPRFLRIETQKQDDGAYTLVDKLERVKKEADIINVEIDKRLADAANIARQGSKNKGGTPLVDEKAREKAYQAAIAMAEAQAAHELAINDYTNLQILGKKKDLEEKKLKIMEQYGKRGSAEYLQQEASLAEARKAIDKEVNENSIRLLEKQMQDDLRAVDEKLADKLVLVRDNEALKVQLTEQAEQKKLEIVQHYEAEKVKVYKEGTQEYLDQKEEEVEATENAADKTVDAHRQSQEAMRDTAETFASGISSTLRQLAEGTQTVGGLFKKLMIDMAESQLKSGLGSLFTGLFWKEGVTGGTSSGSTLSGSATAESGPTGIGKFFQSIPGFAEGGSPPVGTPYWVGERGPELAFDRTPKTVIPNDKISIGGQEQAPVFVYAPNVQTGANAQDVFNALEKHKDLFFGFIKQEKRRNPNIF